MDTAQLINVLAAASSIAAAAVAAYSARIAWKQARLQHEPFLALRDISFQIKASSGSVADPWWEEPSDAMKYINGGSVNYELVAVNTGRGAAFNVRHQLLYDFSVLYEQIVPQIHRYIPNFSIEHDSFGCHAFIDDKCVGGFRLPDQAYGFQEYIGPSTDGPSTGRFIIDPGIAFFISLISFLLLQFSKESFGGKVKRCIDVVSRLEYFNLAGEKRTVDTPFSISIMPGRYRDDLQDGVTIVAFSHRKN